MSTAPPDEPPPIPRDGDAAVFLDWAWSGQSRQGKCVFEEWAGQFQHPIRALIVTPDDDEAAARWLVAECHRTRLPLHGGGHGSLLWVRGGRVIDWIEKLFRCDVAQVEEHYRRSLGNA